MKTNRLIAAVLAAATIGGGAAATAPAAQAATCANATIVINKDNIGLAETAITCLVNQERAKAGLAPLSVNTILVGTARAHSTDMVRRKFFSHINPDGRSPCQRITAAGYPAKCYSPTTCWTGRCGENIAYRMPSATPSQFMYAPTYGWMNSTGHRKAILTANFKHIGVGLALGYPSGGIGSAGVTATQNFGSPS